MSASGDPTDVEGYVALIAQLRSDLAEARKAERERLAAWFESNADTLRGFQDGCLSVEFVSFLLRLAGE